jgi:hypothetical protein
VEQGLVHEGVTLKALGDAAKAIEPGKEAFHHPAVAGKFPVGVGTVFEFSVIGRSPQGNAVANAAPRQRKAKGLAVITPIRRQTTRAGAGPASSSGNLHLSQGQRRSRDISDVALRQMTG